MRRRILAKGVDPATLVIVRDGAEIAASTVANPALDQQVIDAIRGNFRFVLLHAGNLGFYGAWDTLLAGAASLAADGIGFVFVGDVAQRDPAGFAQLARQLSQNPDVLQKMGMAAHAAAPGYERSKELQKLVKIIDEVAENGSNRK